MTEQPVLEFPPTLIIVHAKERRSKCTVQPLRGREGFRFHTFPSGQRADTDVYVRLALDGPPLTQADGDRGLLLLDATWKLAERMEHEYAQVPSRSLPPLRTAYPRTSKLFEDPTPGLATIEAVYAAYFILGRPTHGLLDHYRWGNEFLELNREFFGR